MIVADTSFLFSLFGGDIHTEGAQDWVRKTGRPIVVTALNRYEFTNAVRFAAFRKIVSLRDARASLEAFDADVKRGMLQMIRSDLAAIVSEAEHLSELHTVTGGHRSFDILHVATARVLKASTLLTFDLNQRRLAAAMRVTVGP